MSDTTLYSSLYTHISEYAELIDDLLVSLITNRPEPKLYQRLGETLKQLANSSQPRLTDRMISQLVFEGEAIEQWELLAASDALLNGDIDELTKDVIERLARSLEQERTKAMARIRGEMR